MEVIKLSNAKKFEELKRLLPDANWAKKNPSEGELDFLLAMARNIKAIRDLNQRFSAS